MCGGRELQVLGWHCLNKWDFVRKFKIDVDVLRGWLEFVEESYEDTAYHNREMHACASVMCVACRIVSLTQRIESTDGELFYSILVIPRPVHCHVLYVSMKL